MEKVKLINKLLLATLNNRRGAAFFTVILLLLVSTVLGGALVVSYVSVSRATEIEGYKAQSLYVAEAGVNRVLWRLKNGQATSSPYEETINFSGSGFDGRFSVSWLSGGGQITLTSTGIVPFTSPLKERRAERVIMAVASSTTFQITSFEELTKMR